LIAPPLPPTDEPDPIITDPLFPAFAVPLLNTNMPLAPVSPALAVRIFTDPLVFVVPSPLSRVTDPPVTLVLRPACIRKYPPDPLLPLPTAKLIAPPRPPVAAPDPIITKPLFPELAVPLLNTNMPLAPVPPALAVRIFTDPLVVKVPSPLHIVTDPPVTTVLRPEAKLK
jgi:hypothetical protein